MHLAIEHLVQLGRRRIAVLKGHEYSSERESRWTAVNDAAAEVGVPIDPGLKVQLERIGAEGIAEHR